MEIFSYEFNKKVCENTFCSINSVFQIKISKLKVSFLKSIPQNYRYISPHAAHKKQDSHFFALPSIKLKEIKHSKKRFVITDIQLNFILSIFAFICR